MFNLNLIMRKQIQNVGYFILKIFRLILEMWDSQLTKQVNIVGQKKVLNTIEKSGKQVRYKGKTLPVKWYLSKLLEEVRE